VRLFWRMQGEYFWRRALMVKRIRQAGDENINGKQAPVCEFTRPEIWDSKGTIVQQDITCIYYPALPDLQLHVIHPGLWLGTLKKNAKPSQALAKPKSRLCG
jgi:hypothetical protein